MNDVNLNDLMDSINKDLFNHKWPLNAERYVVWTSIDSNYGNLMRFYVVNRIECKLQSSWKDLIDARQVARGLNRRVKYEANN